MNDIIKSESLKELSIALSNFQAIQKAIKPNSTNPFLKNKYADLTALIEGTKVNLNQNGLSVTQLLTNDGLTTILLHNSGSISVLRSRSSRPRAKEPMQHKRWELQLPTPGVMLTALFLAL